MEAALLAAASADAAGGLVWTGAGWKNPAAPGDYHAGQIVSRLVWTHGFVAEVGPKSGTRQRRVITDKGRAYLAQKEQQH